MASASTPSRVSPSELTELSEDSEDPDASTQILIPKPPGSPGRPGSGEYNLAVAMKWSPSAFKNPGEPPSLHVTALTNYTSYYFRTGS